MSQDRSDSLIVSPSGIRGIFGSGLDPLTAARYGAAFGSHLRRAGPVGETRGRRVLVGRDSRTSGALLVDAVAAGLAAAGWSPADLGIVPTPTALLAVQDDPGAAGGIVVTASHNPAEWNGLKLASADGRFIRPAAGREVQAIFEAEPAWAAWDALGARRSTPGAVRHHLDRILALPLLDVARVRERGFVVALDCVRGAGGAVMTGLLERLGCEVVGFDLEPDGRFPRNPEPTAANLAALGERVRTSGAELGMAVDPDCDRLSLVDGSGRAVGEDWTLALAVELVLEERTGVVVANLSTSQCVQDAAERGGGSFERSPVGEARVAARMEELEATIGGEGNGGVMLPELHLTRDAPLAAAMVLELLARRRRTLAELVGGWPAYRIVKRKASRPEGPLEGLYATLEAAVPGEVVTDRQDGLWMGWPRERRWVHVRPSGTEPILRIVAEAEDLAEAEELADRVEEKLT